MIILADTTFLIDLQRSSRNERYRAAVRWLENHAEVEIVLSSIVLGEFAEGFEDSGHPVIEHFRSAHRVLAADETVAMIYARISRKMRTSGNSIGSNDTWIAATALAFQAPLLTRNAGHFRRVNGLRVEVYGGEE